MPSWVEPSAGANLEAAAYAWPVVATEVGGTPERVVHERTGLLTAAGDVDGLHRHLERLVEQPETARSLGAAGQAMVRADSTWSAVAARMANRIRAELAG